MTLKSICSEIALKITHKPLSSYRDRALQSDFARKVFETYATQIVVIVIGLITNITIARMLGPEGRGIYAVAMTIGLLGVQIGNFGMHGANTYYLARDPSLLPGLLGNSLLASFAVGGLGAIGFFTFSHFFPRLAPLHGTLLVLSLWWIPVGLSYLLSQNLLLALHRVRTYNTLEVTNRLFNLALVGLVIFFGKINPISVFAATLAGVALTVGTLIFALRSSLHAFPWPSLQLLRRNFGIGLKAYGASVFSFLLLRFDLLMVKHMRGAEQTGYYSIASSMADYLLMLPAIIGLLLFPKLSAMENVAEKLRQAKRAALGTGLAMIPLLVFAGLAAGKVVRIMFGRAFLPSTAAFVWLLPGILSMAIEVVIVQFLNSIGYPIIVLWIWFFSVLTNVLLNLWAIPRFGIAGASAMSSISYTLTLVAIFVVIQRGYYTVAPRSNAEVRN